jgi:transcriptional regulator with XRE-family HTH domain
MDMNTDRRRTTTEWLEELGTALRARRIEAGLTQDELADRADVSIGALKNLETGSGANLTTLVKTVRALGREDWLAALAPKAPQVSPMQLYRERQGHARQRVRRQRRP